MVYLLLDVRDLKNSQEGMIKTQYHEPLTSKALSSLQLEFVTPPSVEVTAYLDGDLVHIVGKVKAFLRLPCARCLELHERAIVGDFEASYSFHGNEELEHVEELKGTHIELEPLIVDSLLLVLPMKALCKQDCKGLCSICGQNLNENNCDCDREILDPRLADLKKLLQK